MTMHPYIGRSCGNNLFAFDNFAETAVQRESTNASTNVHLSVYIRRVASPKIMHFDFPFVFLSSPYYLHNDVLSTNCRYFSKLYLRAIGLSWLKFWSQIRNECICMLFNAMHVRTYVTQSAVSKKMKCSIDIQRIYVG